tara:strand:- start:85 stop:498 length:414 start_codon:yes stop_codon:yes gene_type:complete
MKAKEVFWEILKIEVEIGVELAQHWNTYQELSKKEGYENIAKIQFMDCAKIEINKSLFAQEDYYLEWLEEQFENKLPNASSGSTMTALLDLDGIHSMFEDAIEEVGDDLNEELYTLMLNHQRTLLCNLRVERGIDLK